MSDFMAKMSKIQFRLGLRPRLRWGSLQRSPRPPSWIKGPTSKGREEDRKGEGTGWEGGRGGDGKWEGTGGNETPPLHAPPNPYFWIRPCIRKF